MRAGVAATAIVLALAVSGCGGGESDADRATGALTALYVIDNDGANPAGNRLGPYETLFGKLRADCEGSVEDLAGSVQDMASEASNGSGTRVTNLEAMQALVSYLKRNPQPTEDCAGIFVGVEAYLEGDALG